MLFLWKFCQVGNSKTDEIIKEEVKVLVTQSLWDLMDYSPPGSFVHGIPQARTLKCVTISFFRGSSWPRDQTQIFCIAGRLFSIWATREAQKWRNKELDQ